MLLQSVHSSSHCCELPKIAIATRSCYRSPITPLSLKKPFRNLCPCILSCHSHGADIMFWICTPTISPQATYFLASVDHNLLHCCMSHPSKDVLRAVQKHLKGFPDVKIPHKIQSALAVIWKNNPTDHFLTLPVSAELLHHLNWYIQTLRPCLHWERPKWNFTFESYVDCTWLWWLPPSITQIPDLLILCYIYQYTGAL